MQRMKYGPSLLLAEWLGAVLAEHYAALSLTADWAHIIPMSGTPERLAKRGFDQAEVIARTFCTKLCLSQELVNNRILARSFHAKAQADTLHRRRFANSARSLRLRKKPLPGARILLIDDVTTTGASAQQAAILLRNAGASKIDLLSLVRADAWEEYRMTRHQRVPKHLLFRPKLNR
jgi:predicted amidophosphoribosyltransferase